MACPRYLLEVRLSVSIPIPPASPLPSPNQPKKLTPHIDIAVLASSSPSSLQLNLTQNYIFKSPIPLKKEGTSKTVNSKITLNKNSQGLIEEHIEEWDHEKNRTGDDGFMGKLMEGRKKIDAKLVEKTVSSDPSDV